MMYDRCIYVYSYIYFFTSHTFYLVFKDCSPTSVALGILAVLVDDQIPWVESKAKPVRGNWPLCFSVVSSGPPVASSSLPLTTGRTIYIILTFQMMYDKCIYVYSYICIYILLLILFIVYFKIVPQQAWL